MCRNLIRYEGLVTSADRAALLDQKAITLWITGLSGSGKSTLAFALEKALICLGRACYVLDGDSIRDGLNRDLGFSPEDRSENIRRIAEVARLMNDAGLIVISAFISPYRADRDMARAIVGDAAFIEIYLDTPLAACEGRDPKGLYKRARRGEIAEFTGVSAPYEIPSAPALKLDTNEKDVEQCVQLIMEVISIQYQGKSQWKRRCRK